MATELLRLNDVRARVKLSRSTIYLKVKQGRFPRPVHAAGVAATFWRANEIEAWCDSAAPTLEECEPIDASNFRAKEVGVAHGTLESSRKRRRLAKRRSK